ncbi:hypothetical protein BSONL12_02082 [Bacillus sonorensis L12]|uniref:Uncharacterized protein n=1 Tax=Bacillus sonorensis L12 TaxID=1274524 RepID=M5P963_9BACI|nr:hypothetical protein BSONL12_02082 [Bacillus sonorensis L12]
MLAKFDEEYCSIRNREHLFISNRCSVIRTAKASQFDRNSLLNVLLAGTFKPELLIKMETGVNHPANKGFCGRTERIRTSKNFSGAKNLNHLICQWQIIIAKAPQFPENYMRKLSFHYRKLIESTGIFLNLNVPLRF